MLATPEHLGGVFTTKSYRNLRLPLRLPLLLNGDMGIHTRVGVLQS